MTNCILLFCFLQFINSFAIYFYFSTYYYLKMNYSFINCYFFLFDICRPYFDLYYFYYLKAPIYFLTLLFYFVKNEFHFTFQKKILLTFSLFLYLYLILQNSHLLSLTFNYNMLNLKRYFHYSKQPLFYNEELNYKFVFINLYL